MKLAHVVEVTQDVSQHLVFALPPGTCTSCGANLSVHNKATLVKFITVDGLEECKKVNLRCNSKQCRATHQPTRYGKKGDFCIYCNRISVIKVTEGVIVERKQFEQDCLFQKVNFTLF